MTSQSQVLEEARTVMVRNGYDGLLSVIGVEPYGASGSQKHPPTVVPTKRGGMTGGRGGRGGGGRSGNASVGASRDYDKMTGKEKADLCCRNFNLAAGCARTNCRFKHACSVVKPDGRVCWDRAHGAVNHV